MAHEINMKRKAVVQFAYFLLLFCSIYYFIVYNQLFTNSVQDCQIDWKLNKHSLSFSPKWRKFLQKLDLLNCPSGTNWENNSTKKPPVFVTAISNSYLVHAKQLIDSYLNYFASRPHDTRQLIIYDIGLSESARKTLGNLETRRIFLRTFDFGSYPKHVKELLEYRWKPLIIAECLKEFSGFWWLDSSAVFYNHSIDIKAVEKWTISKRFPVTLVENASHSIFAATKPSMYRYLPITPENAKLITMYSANIILFYANSEVSYHIIRWWVLCALEPNCMAPGALACQFTTDRMNFYANCHRFDQSAINIIMALKHNFNENKYHYSIARTPFKIFRNIFESNLNDAQMK